MKKRFKMINGLLLAATVSLLLTGCNIFDFTSDAEKTPTDKAQDLIRDGKYQQARSLLSDSVKDSSDAMALYLDTKATMLAAGVDLVKIAELVDNSGSADEGQSLEILDTIDALSYNEQTAWYHANLDAVANLSKIFYGKIKSDFDPEDIALDYSVAGLMSGVLGIRDTNRDGAIDGNDFKFNINFQSPKDSDLEGYAFDGGTFTNDQGQNVQFTGLEVFLGDYAFGAAKASGLSGYEPDDINDLIAFVMNLLTTSTDGLKILIGKNINTLDPDKIDEYIAEIGNIINFYWYDDGIDNDGDGRTDEETINGKDDDNDGLIDEDTKYYPGADPTNTRNTQYKTLWENWGK